MYSGCIIKESISDESIFDFVTICRTELWRTINVPKYWTAVFFSSDVPDFPERLSQAIIGNWFVDMKIDNTKILVFNNRIMCYTIGDSVGKREVMDYCASIGIPKHQINWSE